MKKKKPRLNDNLCDKCKNTLCCHQDGFYNNKRSHCTDYVPYLKHNSKKLRRINPLNET